MTIQSTSIRCLLIILLFSSLAAAQDLSKPKTVLEWQSEVVRSLAFTSDGKQLIVAPKDNDVWAFDAGTGAKLPEDLKGLRGPTKLLIAGPRPGTVYCVEQFVTRLADVKTGKDLATWGTSADFSPSGQLSSKRDLLVLASASGGVELLSADLKRSEASFEPSDPPPPTPQGIRSSAAAYSPDGKFIAGARPSGRLFLWTADGFKQTGVQAVSAHTAKIEALSFTPSGLVSIGLDGKLKLWSVPEAKELADYSFGAQLDRAWLLAGGQIAALVRKPVAGEIEFFQVPTKEGEQLKLLATIPIVSLFDGFPTVNRAFTIPEIALSPDGQRLALTANSGSSGLSISRIAIYDVSGFMPKLAVASASETDPRVTGIGTKPTPTKTTPAPPPKTEREFREWNTADGQFKVEAQFLGKTGDSIRLKRKDNGKVISVPLEKFSEMDQVYVKSLR